MLNLSGFACRFTEHMWYGAAIYGSSSCPASCLWAPLVCPRYYLTHHIRYLAHVVIGSSIALLVETARPGAVFGTKLISDFGIAFWSISVSLNVISTLLIAGLL